MDVLNLYGAFVYGLSSSLSLCLASCLPFYMPVLFGYGQDHRKGLMLSLGFAAGRFAGYFTLGIVAAFLGKAFIGFFNYTFPAISTAFVFAFGLITVFYGTVILARAEVTLIGKGHCRTYLKRTKTLDRPFLGTTMLGFVSTITPCVPVFTFLLLPFAMGRVWDTAALTVAFGLGANMVFIIIGLAIGFGMKNVNERFNELKRPLEAFSAAALIIFGLFYLFWASAPALLGWSNPSHQLPSVYDFADIISYFAGI